MPLPRVRKQIVAAQLPDGTPITVYAYHTDAPLVDRSWEQEADGSHTLVLITADGDPLEWRAPGVYYLPLSQQVVTSADPAAP